MVNAYRAAQAAARRLVTAYYPSVEVVGLDRVPDGPLVVAANHPNSLFDPVMLAAYFPRRIRWLAKAPLFDVPGLRRILRAFGVIPVHRRHEGGTRDTTSALLSTAAEAVAGGDAIGIFPEGTSHDLSRLAPLKTGAGRIAVLAAELAGTQVNVLPVALHFADKTRFRSEAVVAVGRPLVVSASDDPEKVTATLKLRIEELLAHVEDDEQAGLLAAVRVLERQRLAHEVGAHDAAARHRIALDMARAVRRFSHEEPGRVEQFRSRLLAYLDRLERQGLSPEIVDHPRLEPRRVPRLVLALALLPVAAFGALHSWIPLRLSGWLGDRWIHRERQARLAKVAAGAAPGTPDDETTVATNRLLAGALLFGVAWPLEALAVGMAWGPWAGVAFLVLAPPTALAARYAWRVLRRQVGRLADLVLIGARPNVLESLREERQWLLAEVERWRGMLRDPTSSSATERPSHE